MEFKDKVKTLRKKCNLTMDELGEKIGVSAPTIQRYESGEIKNIRHDKIKLLADALETTPAYLMGWEDKPLVDDNDDLDVRRIQRARKLMPEKDKQKMMDILKLTLGEYFSDDYVEDDLDE